MNRRVFLAALVAVASLPSLAHAHAMLVSSTPAVGVSVTAAPSAITLTFTQPVDPSRCAIKLARSNGEEIELGQLTTNGNGSVLTAPIAGELSAGVYAVHWQAINMEGHETSGDFEFRVAN